jgi:hypothetical protein
VDLTAQTTLVELEMVTENSVAADLEIINETASEGDTWIRQRTQPVLTKKLAMKVLPWVTHRFMTADIPC